MQGYDTVRIARWYLTAATWLLLVLAGSAALAQANDEAARHFDRGQQLYKKGDFKEAIKAYEAANGIAPHPAALFNIARCHVNLGHPEQALKYYKMALHNTSERAGRADIEQRIKRLQSRPVKVFVGSRPSGASVTVDGARQPARGQTPLVLNLSSGEHVLLLRKQGYKLVAHRVEVEVGKELAVELALEPLPAPCKPQPPPCARCKKCPELKLVEMEPIHMHASIMGVFGLTLDRPLAGGPGLQIFLTYKQLMFATHFLYLPIGEENIEGTLSPDSEYTYDEVTMRWLMVQVEAGYVFPFKTWYLYTTGGLGVNSDQVIAHGTKVDKESKKTLRDAIAKDNLGFVWSVGAGLEAMATDWFSFGIAARFGLIHGKRASRDDPMDLKGETTPSTHPYGTFWGTVTFHL